MIFKNLFILFFISTCIKMNSGANENSYFWTDDFINDFYPSEEEKFQDQSDKQPAQQIKVDVNEDPFTNIDSEEREKHARNLFEIEYHVHLRYYLWPELLNYTYDNSWNILCYKLWKNPVLTQRCGARKLTYYPSYHAMYRVTGRNDQVHNFFELLNCTCPFRKHRRGSQLFDIDHYFFVIPSKKYQQYYYILRLVDKLEVKIFDMRKAEFDLTQPNFDPTSSILENAP